MTLHEKKSTLILALTCLAAGTLLLFFGGENMEKPATLLLWLGGVAALVRLASFFLSRKSKKNKRRKPYSQAPAETDAYLAYRIMTMLDNPQRHYESLPPGSPQKKHLRRQMSSTPISPLS